MSNLQDTAPPQGVLLPPPPRRLIRVFVRIGGKVKVDYQEDNHD
jgi:hypothetical protein